MSYNISVVQMRMIEDFAGAYRNQVWVWYLGWRAKCSSLEVRNLHAAWSRKGSRGRKVFRCFSRSCSLHMPADSF